MSTALPLMELDSRQSRAVDVAVEMSERDTLSPESAAQITIRQRCTSTVPPIRSNVHGNGIKVSKY